MEMEKSFFMMIGLAAMTTVGTIEVLKNFLILENKKIWTIVMIVLAPIYCAIYFYLPLWVIGCILAICLCQIGYDSIVKTYHSLVDKIGNKT